MYLPYDYYRNSERYADPTAGEAMMNVMLEQKKQQAEKQRRMYEMTHRPKVYIVSKYTGDTEANTAAAIQYCRFAIEQGYMPIASHLLYPQILNDNDPAERELGLMFGIALLAKCNEVWCFGDERTAGMLQEIKMALKLKKQIRFFSVKQEEHK